MTIHFKKFTRLFTLAWLILVASNLNCVAQAQPPADPEKAAAQGASAKERAVYLIEVSLPIDSESAARAKQALQNVLDASDDLFKAEDRPIAILEFAMTRGATGQDSSLGACIDLARFLISQEMSWLQTIAFVPGKPTTTDLEDEKDRGQLSGHAVLIALAADQLAIAPKVKIGDAASSGETIDELTVVAYETIVGKRLNVPVPVALAMLDKNRELFKVKKVAGFVYVDRRELERLENNDESRGSETLSSAGSTVSLSGTELAQMGIIRKPIDSRVELAKQLSIRYEDMQIVSRFAEQWTAIRVELNNYVDDTDVQWIIRAIEPKVAGSEINLIIFEFNSESGDADACLKLSRKIADLHTSGVRTVAYINSKAAGPAAMVALSCFHVIAKQDGTIGGSYSSQIAPEKIEKLMTVAAGIAETTGKDAAPIQAMLNPELEVNRYRNKRTNQERLLTVDEHGNLSDSENWLLQGAVDFTEPLSATNAEKLGVARQLVSSIDGLKSFYQLEQEPELLKPTSIDRTLNRIANYLASPFIAPWLLFFAMFLIFNEVSQPGLGLPGFAGTICLVLYFWSQHLEGNADWFEILLFVTGVAFLLIEAFVVPGFGLFGIGGLIMVVVSIVLAAQTVNFPTTAEGIRQLPRSLFALAGAIGGVIVALVALRTVLPNTPYFKRMMLEPPTDDGDGLFDKGSGSLIGPQLVGRQGVAITDLAPSGKARINGQLIDVITEGRLIEKDHELQVIEVAGNRVVVAGAEEPKRTNHQS